MALNYATKRLLDAARRSLSAWEGEERYLRESHPETIEELRDALLYFDAHGETQKAEA